MPYNIDNSKLEQLIVLLLEKYFKQTSFQLLMFYCTKHFVSSILSEECGYV